MKQLFCHIYSCRPVKCVVRWLSYLAVLRLSCPDVRGIEAVSALGALWWTFQLLGTPKIFSTTASFAGLAERGREREWGLATAFLAVLGLQALVGASATIRFCAAAVSFVLWTTIALNLAQAAPWVHPTLFGVELAFTIPQSTGAGMYGIVALFSGGVVWKLRVLVINDLHAAIVRCAGRLTMKSAG